MPAHIILGVLMFIICLGLIILIRNMWKSGSKERMRVTTRNVDEDITQLENQLSKNGAIVKRPAHITQWHISYYATLKRDGLSFLEKTAYFMAYNHGITRKKAQDIITYLDANPI